MHTGSETMSESIANYHSSVLKNSQEFTFMSLLKYHVEQGVRI